MLEESNGSTGGMFGTSQVKLRHLRNEYSVEGRWVYAFHFQDDRSFNLYVKQELIFSRLRPCLKVTSSASAALFSCNASHVRICQRETRPLISMSEQRVGSRIDSKITAYLYNEIGNSTYLQCIIRWPYMIHVLRFENVKFLCDSNIGSTLIYLFYIWT